MPVGPTTQGPPRQKTAFDLQRGGRGPNDGTEWSGEEGANPNAIFDSGDTSSPNRFNVFNDPLKPGKKGKKAKPIRRLIDEVMDEKGFDCRICSLHFATMDTFNRHCEIDPRSESGKEIRCQVDKRLFEEKNATDKAHMLDPMELANSVAEALKPTLLSIVDVLKDVKAALSGRAAAPAAPAEPDAPGPTWSNPTVKAKKEGKKRAGSRLVRGAAPARRAEPVGSVEPKPAAVADPQAEPQAPE